MPAEENASATATSRGDSQFVGWGMHRPDRILNDLIAACRDSAEGFGKAAKGAHSDHLRDQFTEISRARSDFADQLTRLAGELGFTPAARVRAYAKNDGAHDTEVEPGPGSLLAFLANAPPPPRIS